MEAALQQAPSAAHAKRGIAPCTPAKATYTSLGSSGQGADQVNLPQTLEPAACFTWWNGCWAGSTAAGKSMQHGCSAKGQLRAAHCAEGPKPYIPAQ